MKKSCTLILAGLAVLSGCSTAPVAPESGVGTETVTLAYGKVLNVKEYSHIYSEIQSTPKQQELQSNKAPIGKNYSLGRPVADDNSYEEFISAPIPSIDMVELHIQTEHGPNFKIDQVKNGYYYMGQRIRITMTETIGKITPY